MATKKILKAISTFVVTALLAGCASTLNPYSGEFECPQMEKGKCVGIPTAYKEAVSGGTLTLEEKGKEKQTDFSYIGIEAEYRGALFQRLAKLLKEPKTPLLAPPKVVRVMVMPYQSSDSKEFYSARYVYVLIDDPQWILQNLMALPPEGE